jgi:molybdenum cofactor cytidylyltransferase
MPSPPTEPLRVAGIVLAAGQGRRMGENKMRIRLGGESLVRRAARRALDGGLSPVVVVLGHDADHVAAELDGLACELALNPEYTGPTSGSLHRGLERLGSDVDAAVVLLGDMVHVSSEMFNELRRAASESDAPPIVSRYGDVNAPPLLFRRSLFPELLAWTGEGCGKEVVRRHRHEAVYRDWPIEALTDIDTPSDLAAARAVIDAAGG